MMDLNRLNRFCGGWLLYGRFESLKVKAGNHNKRSSPKTY